VTDNNVLVVKNSTRMEKKIWSSKNEQPRWDVEKLYAK
jgi:hypothetical protein